MRISSSSGVYVGNPSNEHLIKSVNLVINTRPVVEEDLVTLRTNLKLCDTYEAQEAIAFLGQEGKVKGLFY